MIIQARSVGIKEADFWLMTPREFWRCMKGEDRRLEIEAKARKEAAWYAAALPRTKKFPDFDEFVNGKKSEKVDADEGFRRLEAMLNRRPKEKAKQEWQSEQ